MERQATRDRPSFPSFSLPRNTPRFSAITTFSPFYCFHTRCQPATTHGTSRFPSFLCGVSLIWNAYGGYTVGSGKGTGYTKKGDTTAFRVGSVLIFCCCFFVSFPVLFPFLQLGRWAEAEADRMGMRSESTLSPLPPSSHKTDKARLRGLSRVPPSGFTSLGLCFTW